MSVIDVALRGQQVIITKDATCTAAHELLRHPLVELLAVRFLRRLRRVGSPLVDPFAAAETWAGRAPNGGGDDADRRRAELVVLALRSLAESPCAGVMDAEPRLEPVLRCPHLFHDFVEAFYDYWRSRERYLLCFGPPDARPAADEHRTLLRNTEALKALVLETYRAICANLTGERPAVYRQVPAGVNAGLYVQRVPWACPGPAYDGLREVPFIRLGVLEPPAILYSRRNVREGGFFALDENPIAGLRLDPAEWLCYPARIGPLTILVFFHCDYISLGSSLINLFQVASDAEIARPPDGILVFGVSVGATPGGPAGAGISDAAPAAFFEDTASGLLVGAVARCADVDYFGYFKKMALTLHNVVMMRRGRLPVHGAMTRIALKNGNGANVVIVGDSGAGKSESLEAFRVLADEHIRELVTVFDDMGALALDGSGHVVAYGTETGAFVRLDDLQPGYAFGQMDRAIFMNPHRANARVVIPVTQYRHVVAGYPVDMFLYANNYEPVDEARPFLEVFSDVGHALEVFRDGARLARGTTDECGLVRTYFANPFGPPQYRDVHEELARRYFEAMFSSGVTVGQLRTRLALPGFATKGPETAAAALFEHVGGAWRPLAR